MVITIWRWIKRCESLQQPFPRAFFSFCFFLFPGQKTNPHRHKYITDMFLLCDPSCSNECSTREQSDSVKEAVGWWFLMTWRFVLQAEQTSLQREILKLALHPNSGKPSETLSHLLLCVSFIRFALGQTYLWCNSCSMGCITHALSPISLHFL